MAHLLAGKVIAITGASTGIGRATAIECARNGARLLLHHLGNDQARYDMKTLRGEIAAANSRDVADIGLDVTDPAAGSRILDAAMSAFGRIDGCVNNVGICQFEDFVNITPAQRDLHMAINYAAPFSITQAVVQQMISQRSGGAIVNIASITALLGSSKLTHYSPTKAAVLGMTNSCAVALGKYGIRFNAVSPGTTETSMNKADLTGSKRGEMEARVPLGRLGKPEDIAKPVVFFLSDMAAYVSGQNLIVDGASSINYQ